MKTLNDEDFVLYNYRNGTGLNNIKFVGRFFNCLRIKILTKNIFFRRLWINSSSKSDLPPDFHNDRHHAMLEIMRIDDCINQINGKHIVNSFEREKKAVKKYLGMNLKDRPDLTLFFNPDTRNSKEFNFKGYYNNFKRVINDHSNKVEQYHKNYPKCKKVIFLVCDESNNYIQVTNNDDLKKEADPNPIINNGIVHVCYNDSLFLDVIKKCNADYVIWYGHFKSLFVNGKKVDYPRAVIYDVKHIKSDGLKYDHNLMFKVKNEHFYQ